MPDVMTEPEAAAYLRVPPSTLAAERRRGRIKPARIGQRIYRYTEPMLLEYLQRCQSELEKSGATGSPNGAAPTAGAELGSTQLLDKQSAQALGQAIFPRQKSRSASGTQSTANSQSSEPTKSG